MSQVQAFKLHPGELSHFLELTRSLRIYLFSLPTAFVCTLWLGGLPVLDELFWTLAFFAPSIIGRDSIWYPRILLSSLGFLVLFLVLPLNKISAVVLFFTLVGFSRTISLSDGRVRKSLLGGQLQIFFRICSTIIAGGITLFAMERIITQSSGIDFMVLTLASVVGAFIMGGQEFLWTLQPRSFPYESLSGKEFGSVYRDLLVRQNRIVDRVLSTLEKDAELYEVATRIIDQNQSMMTHGNELFEHLRHKKIRLNHEGEPSLTPGQKFENEEFSSEKSKELQIWKERIKAIADEERRIHDTVEANLLKLENLESFIMTQKSDSLHFKQSEIEFLNRPTFEQIELSEERRKALKELENSGFEN